MKSRLKALLADIRKQRQQHDAHRIACDGAMQVLEQLLKEYPPDPEEAPIPHVDHDPHAGQ